LPFANAANSCFNVSSTPWRIASGAASSLCNAFSNESTTGTNASANDSIANL
jgi:hypothetical protein